MNRRHSGGLPGQAPTVAKPMDAGWDTTEPTALPASCRPPRKNNTNRPSRERTTFLRFTLPLVLSSHTRTAAYLGNQGSQTVGRLSRGFDSRPRAAYYPFPPIITMKDSNTPATKADIQEILKMFGNVNERFDRLDQRIDGLDEQIDGLDKSFSQKLDEFREETNRKIDDFREETNQRLDDINGQLQVLIEKTHFDLAEASHDAEEVLKDHDGRLEKRVERLEKAVGLTAA
ncbi:MAG: hypothetical protein GY854_31420 [Deltaproteobacteria bacterium]|nr:hypothetical protein [Deltaproteobacteria bacterium]